MTPTQADTLTRAYIKLLEKENSKADKDINKAMIDTATILAGFYLWYPKVKGYTFRMDDRNARLVFTQLRAKIKKILEIRTANAVLLSSAKNKVLLGEVFKMPVFKTWLNRKLSDVTLSQRIWKYTNMYKMELESRIAVAIVNGEPERTFTQSLIKFLKNPYDTLSVTDPKLWKARRLFMKYKPGTGVYKSSYANIKRLVRTELFSSYRKADNIIWNLSDKVKGVLVYLNSAHPKEDICDYMVGIYPKSYLFLGFHSACICLARPILEGEFIKRVPMGAKRYIDNLKLRGKNTKLQFWEGTKGFW